MKIVFPELVEDADSTLTASQEAKPADNLAVLQPSVRWRATTISGTPWVQWAAPTVQSAEPYSAVSLVGYDGAPTRNMLRQARELDGSDWTVVSGAVVAEVTEDPPEEKTFQPFSLARGVSSGDAYVFQILAWPGVGTVATFEAMPLRVGVLFKQLSPHDLDLRIIAHRSGLIGSQEARADYDISAGTAGAGSASGNFTVDDTSIVPLSNGWYLCTLEFTTDEDDTDMRVRFQLLDGGSTTIPASEGARLGLPALFLQSAEDGIGEWPNTASDAGGPMWRLVDPDGFDALTTWQHLATRNSLRSFARYSAFMEPFDHATSVLTSSRLFYSPLRVELYDPYNELGYLEAGRLLVGGVLDLRSVLDQIVYDPRESGGEQEAGGGQQYRPQRKVRRGIRVDLHYMTYAQAMDSIHYLQRTRGRSRPVLAVIPERIPEGAPAAQQARYTQENLIYGYIDRLDRVPRAGMLYPDYWMHSVTIREAP